MGTGTSVVQIPRGLWGAVFLSSAGVLPDGPGTRGTFGQSPAGRLLETTTHGAPYLGDGRVAPYGATMPPQGAGVPQTLYQHRPYVAQAPTVDAAAPPSGYSGA